MTEFGELTGIVVINSQAENVFSSLISTGSEIFLCNGQLFSLLVLGKQLSQVGGSVLALP